MRTIVTLDKVDYSPARNSCVAEVEITSGVLVFESVRDLLSGETLFSLPCNKDCVEEFQKRQFVDPAFDYVMNNADEPVALGKQYVQMQSDLAHKTTAPASSVAEPNDWQTVPAREYDAQGKPIASPQSPGTGKQDFYPDTGKPIRAPGPKHKTYFDPNTGEPIQIDPVTGERIQTPASQRKSAPTSSR